MIQTRQTVLLLIKMYSSSLCRSLLQLRLALPAQTANIHASAVLYAAKKTTSAAGGVMGLGKGKKKGGKLTAVEKKEMPVESDPNRLISHVCGSNIYVTGEDVQIKPDSEYPDWLWSLRTAGALPLEELDPDSKQYWVRVRAAGMRRNNKLRSMRKF